MTNGQVAGHAQASAQDIARWRAMSLAERSQQLEAACRAAAVLARDRAKANAPPIQPVPWPHSTWEFLRERARCVQSRSTQ